MARHYSFTAIYVEDEDGWVVALAGEFPLITTQGRTIEEAREYLRDAVEAVIAANLRTTRESVADRRVLLVEEEWTGRPV